MDRRPTHGHTTTTSCTGRRWQPGVYNATLLLRSNSGRQPSLRIPVSLLVPVYRQGLNADGNAYVDSAIGGADDYRIFQDARRDQRELELAALAHALVQDAALLSQVR